MTRWENALRAYGLTPVRFHRRRTPRRPNLSYTPCEDCAFEFCSRSCVGVESDRKDLAQ